jgi:hypothetical protein
MVKMAEERLGWGKVRDSLLVRRHWRRPALACVFPPPVRTQCYYHERSEKCVEMDEIEDEEVLTKGGSTWQTFEAPQAGDAS